jgi:hypothetical protein
MGLHTNCLVDVSRPASFLFRDNISRYSVPFLFLSVSYFFFRYLAEDSRASWRFLGKMLSLYCLWSFVYLAPAVYHAVGRHELTSSLGDILREFTLVGGPCLWCFKAIPLSILLVCFLRRAISLRLTLAIALVLHLAFIACEPYRGVALRCAYVGDFYAWYMRVFGTLRGELLYGFFWAALGCYLASVEWKPRTRVFGFLFLVFFLLTVMETALLRSHEIAADFKSSLCMVPGATFLLLAIISFAKDMESGEEPRFLSSYRDIIDLSVLSFLGLPIIELFGKDVLHLQHLPLFILAMFASVAVDLAIVFLGRYCRWLSILKWY